MNFMNLVKLSLCVFLGASWVMVGSQKSYHVQDVVVYEEPQGTGFSYNGQCKIFCDSFKDLCTINCEKTKEQFSLSHKAIMSLHNQSKPIVFAGKPNNPEKQLYCHLTSCHSSNGKLVNAEKYILLYLNRQGAAGLEKLASKVIPLYKKPIFWGGIGFAALVFGIFAYLYK